MVNTMYFTQCKDCEYCVKELFGYCCDNNFHSINNPDVDGCTFGKEKEDGERREGE